MSATFAGTTRALAADGPRRGSVALVVALVVIGGWTAWFVRAPITEREVTDAGRIEVAEAAHPVDAPVATRVVAVGVTLGQEVAEGDVLVELDVEIERRRLLEERTKLSTIQPQIAALDRQVAATTQALVDDRSATTTSLAQARARREDSEAQARRAADEVRRAEQLLAHATISELEAARARTEDERRRAQLDVASLEVSRIDGELRTRESQGRSRLEDLRRDLASLEGEQARSGAAISLLEHAIAVRTVRSPCAGRIGELAAYRVGSFVKEGERLAVIVPAGRLRAVGDFAPEGALGRIRPGQSARVRLQGFPWMRYGTVPAKVVRVGSELRDGRVRVELAVFPEASSTIPLQHGLPGAIEVDIEQTTPLSIVLRSAGAYLGRSADGK